MQDDVSFWGLSQTVKTSGFHPEIGGFNSPRPYCSLKSEPHQDCQSRDDQDAHDKANLLVLVVIRWFLMRTTTSVLATRLISSLGT